MTAPLCAMWQGRCPNPAHLVITVTKHINGHDVPVPPWPVCDDTRCWEAAHWHAEQHGLDYVGSHRITPADIEAITSRVEVAA